MLTRRILIGAMAACGLATLALQGAAAQTPAPQAPAPAGGPLHHGLLHHLDDRLRPVQPSPSRLPRPHRRRGQGGEPGNRQALDTGRRGDADVVFVHARAQEERFVAEGHGVERRPVMYNDFVLIGPKSDPAGIAGQIDIAAALRAVQAKGALFISRGDRSGTHAAELALWQAAGLAIETAKGPWYREIGQGMGAALNMASAQNGYVLSDRATWLNFRNRGDLRIVVEGDRRLFNQYGVILVNPARHPHVKRADGQAFIDWLLSPEGQGVINAYRINGEQLFFANATQPGAVSQACLLGPNGQIIAP